MSAGCCARPVAGLRLAPFDCFQRGLATRSLPPLALAGDRVDAANGLWAQFSVRVAGRRMADLRFGCASCTTLIACCQALVELNRNCPQDSLCVRDPDALWKRLPGMPQGKRDRAVLAVAALRSALTQAEALPVASKEEA